MLANILGSLTELLYSIPCILIALTVHEVAHGWMAYKLGDPTAKTMGRLTLNPLKHLDPIGALCMLFFHFGWAKPVPIDSRYFKKPKRDVALTALAGPVSNILMAFCGILLFSILRAVFVQVGAASSFGATIQQLVLYLLFYFYSLNLSLAVFNFLPVPPLDGYRVVKAIFANMRNQNFFYTVERYSTYIGLAVLLIISQTGVLDICSDGVFDLLSSLCRLIYGAYGGTAM